MVERKKWKYGKEKGKKKDEGRKRRKTKMSK